MRKFALLFPILVLAWAMPARANDRPSVKLSFSLPTESPTSNAFDPAPLNFYRTQGFALYGHPDGALVPYRTMLLSAFATPQRGKTWGARLRIQTWSPWRKERTPLALDLSWIKEQRSLVQVFPWDVVQVGRYHEDCPAANGPCVDFSERLGSDDSQYREHDLRLHVFRAGLAYDLLYHSKRLSLEPGIGIEWSLAKDRRTAIHLQSLDGADDQEIQNVVDTTWRNTNRQTGYLSLSGDIYPLGKRRFLAVGANSRYLLSSGDWTIKDGMLFGDYEIPIRSERWSTSFHATLAL